MHTHMHPSLLSTITICLFIVSAAAAATGPSAAFLGTSTSRIGPGVRRACASWLMDRRSLSLLGTTPKTNTSNNISSAGGNANTSSSDDARMLDSPSAQRNKEPILSILKSEVMPLLLHDRDASTCGATGNGQTKQKPSLTVLEVAAGCGVHTLHIARGLVGSYDEEGGGVEASCTWYPTDPSPSSRDSINARAAAAEMEMASLPAEHAVIIQPAQSLTLDADGIVEGRNVDGGISALPNPIADIASGSLDLITNVNMIHISPWSATLGLMKISSELLRPGGILFSYGPYKVNGTAAESNLRFDESLKSRDASWGVRDLEEVVKEAERQGLKLIKMVEMPANNLSVIYQKG